MAAILAGSLWPFQPGSSWPQSVRNELERLADGSLRFVGTSIARTSAPPAWLGRVIAGAPLALEIEARAAGIDQDGPARIVTISADVRRCNLMLGQDGRNALLRLRRRGSDANGRPAFVVPDAFPDTDWHRFGIVIASGELQVIVDGQERLRKSLGEAPLASWSPAYRLALGNEPTLGRPWRGDVRRATVDVAGESIDYVAASELDAPAFAWRLSEEWRSMLRPDRRGTIVELAHFLAFFFFGIAFALATLPERLSPWRLAGWAAAFGLAKELAKLSLAERHATLLHVAPEILGALLGAYVFALVRRRQARVHVVDAASSK